MSEGAPAAVRVEARSPAGGATPALPRLWERAAPVVLLGLFAVLAAAGTIRQSPTVDEVYHLASGYSLLKTGDTRLVRDVPPLMRALAGVPLLALRLDPVEETPGWRQSSHREFEHHFYCCNLRRMLLLVRLPVIAVGVLQNRVPAQRLALLARLPVVGLGLLLGLVLYRWALEPWGPRPALGVLGLFTICPDLWSRTTPSSSRTWPG
jgi:hypothetical protein